MGVIMKKNGYKKLFTSEVYFSPGMPVSFTNKNNQHDITEILLKVASNTIKQTNKTIEEDIILDIGMPLFAKKNIKLRLEHKSP
jgi:hypothetical protein